MRHRKQCLHLAASKFKRKQERFSQIFPVSVKSHVMSHTSARLPVFSVWGLWSPPSTQCRAARTSPGPEYLNKIFLGWSSEKKIHLERPKIPSKRGLVWEAVSILSDLFGPLLLVDNGERNVATGWGPSCISARTVPRPPAGCPGPSRLQKVKGILSLGSTNSGLAPFTAPVLTQTETLPG